MRKKFLEKRMQRLTARRDELKAKALASTDVNEVRSINSQLDELADEIEEVQEEMDVLASEERSAEPQGEARQTPPQNARLVNGQNVGSYTQQTGEQTRASGDMFATMEYRQAFMKYAQTGEAIPAKYARRDAGAANTDTLGATIPTTVLNEFIDLVRTKYGNLYSKVRKLNVKGAVKIPIAELQASFKWITEATVAPREDGGKINSYIEFSYNLAEIRVSQTLLSSIVTIDLFEREIINVMMKAYLQAMDYGILKGTGVGQMLGILNDSRVVNSVTMTADQMNDWKEWRKRLFAQMPLGYRSGDFIFPIGTVDTYLETMADDNNNPIFRQATGLEVNDADNARNGRFFGREVDLVETDILPNFDDASDGDVIGVYWQPEEYAINTNMQFGMNRWFDNDRNEWVNKMLTIVDGKVLNPNGIWLIRKAST